MRTEHPSRQLSNQVSKHGLHQASQSRRDWFIFQDDLCEGPFSAEDLKQKTSQGSLNETDYVWKEGMADWRELKEIDEFLPELNDDELSSKGHGQDSESSGTHSFRSSLKPTFRPGPFKPSGATKKPGRFYRSSAALGAVSEFSHPALPHTWQHTWEQTWQHTLRIKVRWVSVGLLIFLLGWVSLRMGWIPGRFLLGDLPEWTDLTSEEANELRSTYTRLSHPSQLSVAIGLSRADLYAPFFHLSSNQSKEMQLTIYVQGIPQTLIDQMHISQKATVKMKGGYARTPIFRELDGKPFPRGEYVVSVIQEGAVKPISRKTYFLGGLKDASYEDQLKRYHAHLWKDAQFELLELKQFYATLEDQLKDTLAHSKKSQARSEGLAEDWKTFHSHWVQLETQLKEGLKATRAEKSQKGGFYPKTFLLLTEFEEKLSHFHSEQQNGMKSNSRDFRKSRVLLQDELKEIQTKIEQIEKTHQSSSGIPQE